MNTGYLKAAAATEAENITERRGDYGLPVEGAYVLHYGNAAVSQHRMVFETRELAEAFFRRQ